MVGTTIGERQLVTLTEHEWKITTLIALGHSNRMIAQAQFISPETLRHHLKNIRQKFGVRTTQEAGRLARKAGILNTYVINPVLERPVFREEIDELAAELFRLMAREPRSRSRRAWIDLNDSTRGVYRRLAAHSLAYYHHMLKADRNGAAQEHETNAVPAVPA